ncbi:MAG: phosphatase PAP2 family protein [Muribaculaceae bacterium]|nr:phosphatase PAP2 family protein [Roseburia sp.]MCM1430218.1 phosphatase PAP2 family protein [Muribaculaceae bacterium]MCM1493700.1 phosphatase PAP2 family protein [Muribaculaceae bacterium]
MDWEFALLYGLQEMHNPMLDKIMVALSTLGNAGTVWILTGVLLLFTKEHKKAGVQMLAAMAFVFVVGNLILKNLAARDRPCWIDPGVALLVKSPGDYSFPSGHTMNGFVSAVSLFCIDRRTWPALLLAGAIAFSRLYLFVHFPTDVLAGLVIGVGAALLVDDVFRKKNWK